MTTPRIHELAVLKFGGSVLETDDGYRAAAGEIARQRASGRRVVAVVSARTGATDELLRLAHSLNQEPSLEGLTRARLALRTSGPRLDADPVSVDLARLHGELLLGGVVVVPGFVGVHADGGPSLLGRGGSDLTALFLAHALGAVECRLLKDVDGSFTGDPTDRAARVERYARAAWDEVARVGNGLIQRKALQFATAHGLGFWIAAIGGQGTWVGAGPTELSAPALLEVAS